MQIHRMTIHQKQAGKVNVTSHNGLYLDNIESYLSLENDFVCCGLAILGECYFTEIGGGIVAHSFERSVYN